MLTWHDLGMQEIVGFKNRTNPSAFLRLIGDGYHAREIIDTIFSQESKEKQQEVEKFLYENWSVLRQLAAKDKEEFKDYTKKFYVDVLKQKIDTFTLHTGHSFTETFNILVPHHDFFLVDENAKVYDEGGTEIPGRFITSDIAMKYTVRASWVLFCYVNSYGVNVKELAYAGKLDEIKGLDRLAKQLLI